MRLHPHFIIQSTEEDLTKKKEDIARRDASRHQKKEKSQAFTASELLLNPFNVNATLILCL